MLPEDRVTRSRLLRCARLLLDCNQARLACEVGVSTSTIYAVELGRLSAASPAAQSVVLALERGGVQFIDAADPLGPGLRYSAPWLYDYENEVIRPIGEVRVHFALNCMARDKAMDHQDQPRWAWLPVPPLSAGP